MVDQKNPKKQKKTKNKIINRSFLTHFAELPALKVMAISSGYYDQGEDVIVLLHGQNVK